MASNSLFILYPQCRDVNSLHFFHYEAKVFQLSFCLKIWSVFYQRNLPFSWYLMIVSPVYNVLAFMLSLDEDFLKTYNLPQFLFFSLKQAWLLDRHFKKLTIFLEQL